MIEDASSGASLLQELGALPRADRQAQLIPIEACKDKRTRAEAQTTTIEGGFAHLLEAAPWLQDLFKEIRDFPRAHDDQVDSTTQFLQWARTRIVYAKRIPVRWPT